MANETSPNGGNAGAITIEPIRIGTELVSKATAANTPEVAMNIKYEAVNSACFATLARVRLLTAGLKEDTG